MPMLVFGIILIFQRAKTLNGIGYILAGLGFLFLGIHYMKEGFEAFKSTIDLTQFAVSGLAGLFLFTAIGVFATVVMQSSHATLVLIITALAAQQITYENALALAIGANIGTTITAIIGAMSANEQGKRLAGAHLIFNVITGVIAIILMPQFIWGVDNISQAVGIAATDYTLKLAVFHTLFNLVGILVMIPFIQPMVDLLYRIIPGHMQMSAHPRYLEHAHCEFPDTALRAVRNETAHMFQNSRDLIGRALNLNLEDLRNPKRDLAPKVHAQSRMDPVDLHAGYEQEVKPVYSAILAFISRSPFCGHEVAPGKMQELREANRNIIEAIKGVESMQKNLMAYTASDNRHIREQYNMLRIHIGTALQEIEGCRSHPDPSPAKARLNLARFQARYDDYEKAFSSTLYQLIRNDSITPVMGSSLMNDGSQTFLIINHLLAMAATLFVESRQKDDKPLVYGQVEEPRGSDNRLAQPAGTF